MVVNRVWAMPHKNTFSIKPIGELVERYTSGEKVIIDPFANNCNCILSNANAVYK